MRIASLTPLTLAVGVAALAALPSAANAVGFGRVVTQTTLGAPLNFVVSVTVDADEPSAGDCATAQVMFGDSTVTGDNLRVSFEAARGSGERRVRVATLTVVDEPIVTVNVILGCTSQVSRRFVAFADPPVVRLATAETESAPAADAGDVAPRLSEVSRAFDLGRRGGAPARSAVRTAPSAERLAMRRPPAEQRVAAATGAGEVLAPRPRPAPRRTSRIDAPAQLAAAPGRSAPRLRLEATTALAAAPAAAASAAARTAAVPLGTAPVAATPPTPTQPMSPATSSAPAVAEAPAADAVARDRIQALEANLARMRSDAQGQQKTLGALQARLRQAESDRYANGLVYTLAAGVIFFALVAVLLWAVLRPRKRRQSRWFDGHSKLPRAAARTREPLAEAAPAAVAPEVLPRPSMSRPLEHDSSPSIESRTAPASIGGLEVTTVIEPHAHLPAVASDTASQPTGIVAPRSAAASMEELIDLEQQAEFFVVLGQDEAAIALLGAQIGEGGATSPLPYLQLLEIHQRRSDRTAYEEVREKFQQQFNAFAPDWSSDLHFGRSLEGYPQMIARLQALWSTPLHAMQTLDSLLFRRSASDENFDFPAYRELLFLYSIARELAGNVETDFGAIDLFLPLDDGARPVERAAAAPSHEVDVDLDVSSWNMPEEDDEALVVRRSVGRH